MEATSILGAAEINAVEAEDPTVRESGDAQDEKSTPRMGAEDEGIGATSDVRPGAGHV
jgi:hypothetical protein